MAKRLYSIAPETIEMEEVTEPELGKGQVRIRSSFCTIKHGTDFLNFSGKSPFKGKYFDMAMRMFMEKPEADVSVFPKTAVGNTIVGTIMEVGPEVINHKVGDRVFCYGPISDRHVVDEERLDKVLSHMTDQDAACVDPAVNALAAVRESEAKVGDRVAVFGLGAIGLLIIQLLRLNGCMDIIAIDPIAKRRDQALRTGATLALDPTAGDIGLEVHQHLGVGCDIVIEASGSYQALKQAMRCVRMCGSITTLGYYKGTDAHLVLGEEWMHNRLTMKSCLVDWENPMREYPSWDRKRVVETVKQLFDKGLLKSGDIIDPIVTFADAVEGVMDVYRNQDKYIKVGIRCD